MIEKHLLGNFIPKDMKYIILGSFYSKGLSLTSEYDWYYGSKHNQLWKILEKVYEVPLKDKNSKVELFKKIKIGFADIVESCERKNDNSSDLNLINITYNESIIEILNKYNLKKVYFTSAFVEKNFNNYFLSKLRPNLTTQFIRLPSPSPRYAKISLKEKIRIYKYLLPKKLVD